MRGEAVAIASTLLTPCGGFENGVDQDRPLDGVAGFELGQKLVEIMDVPGALDLGQHDDVELVADRGDDLGDVVERPGRVERVDARPQAGRAEIGRLGHGDEALARRLLGIGRDRVLEIAEHDVDLPGELRHLGGDLLDMRRHEMDHALELDRQLAQRLPARRSPAADRIGAAASCRSFQNAGLPFRGKQAPRQVRPLRKRPKRPE